MQQSTMHGLLLILVLTIGAIQGQLYGPYSDLAAGAKGNQNANQNANTNLNVNSNAPLAGGLGAPFGNGGMGGGPAGPGGYYGPEVRTVGGWGAPNLGYGGFGVPNFAGYPRCY